MSLNKPVRRFAVLALILGFMMSLPMPQAMAHGTPCTPSDRNFFEPDLGPGYVKLNSRWQCGESHYKWEMRSYAQWRRCGGLGVCGSWSNTGDNDTNTKTQTFYIENHIQVPCVGQDPPIAEWQYRIVIQWAKVYNSNLNLLSDHSRLNAWAGPAHETTCRPDAESE